MRKYLIGIATILLVLVLVFIVRIGRNEPKTKVIEKVKVQTEKTYEEIKKTENIVFLGDSIIDWYPIEEVFGDLPIIRSGIAGYETDDILNNMDDMVYKYNPTKVFILIGTNDLKRDEDKTEITADKIIEIINNIKAKRPMTKIYFQSIYPVNRDEGAAEERYNDEIQEVNKIVEKYCNKNDVTYIDMYDELTDSNGNFKETLTKDGLHPNDLGYARISQVLLKYIYEKE